MEDIKKIKWNFVALLLAIVGALPSTSSAQSCTTPPCTPPPPPAPITLQNPLKVKTIYAFIEQILDIVFKIGTVVAIFFIIYTGFLFVTAQGNETKLATARKAFLYTIIGTALLLGAWVLATAIEGTITQLRES